MSYMLIDGEQRNKDTHGQFELPSDNRRRSIPIGQFAKLIFVNPEASPNKFADRMWVQVTAAVIHSGGEQHGIRYIGKLSNDPPEASGLQHGSEINFGPEHVIDLYPNAQ